MLMEMLREIYLVTAEAAPYILLGLIVAGVLRALMPANGLPKFLEKRRFTSVLGAVGVGAPLPLCSCSVLPLAMDLRRRGASRGTSSAFLISTPQTGFDSVLLTVGMLNPVFAAGRVVGAVVTGVAAGVAQNFLDRAEPDEPAPEMKTKPACCCGGGHGKKQEEAPEKKPWKKRLFSGQKYAFGDLFPMMAKYYTLGLVATGVVMTLLPAGVLENYLGGGLGGMIAVALIGMLFYICSAGATPLAAALIAKGMSPGTAFVFLLAGPVTSLASVAVVRTMLGTRGLAVYLVSIFVCAIGLGLGLDALFGVYTFKLASHTLVHEHASFSWLQHGVTVLFIVLSVYWTFRPYWRKWIKTPVKRAVGKSPAS